MRKCSCWSANDIVDFLSLYFWSLIMECFKLGIIVTTNGTSRHCFLVMLLVSSVATSQIVGELKPNHIGTFSIKITYRVVCVYIGV